MDDHYSRVVIDAAHEPWTVEAAGTTMPGSRLLRYRHEMGYELAAVAPRPLDELDDEALVRLLEEARRRTPRAEPASAMADAA